VPFSACNRSSRWHARSSAFLKRSCGSPCSGFFFSVITGNRRAASPISNPAVQHPYGQFAGDCRSGLAGTARSGLLHIAPRFQRCTGNLRKQRRGGLCDDPVGISWPNATLSMLACPRAITAEYHYHQAHRNSVRFRRKSCFLNALSHHSVPCGSGGPLPSIPTPTGYTLQAPIVLPDIGSLAARRDRPLWGGGCVRTLSGPRGGYCKRAGFVHHKASLYDTFVAIIYLIQPDHLRKRQALLLIFLC
jgi:hypothetical protein